MEIRLITIPNILTLSNLACGSLAVISIVSSADYKSAFLLIILAAVFDFFDGFAARLLKQNSRLGVELDSLADMVSFGLAPALIMMSMMSTCENICDCLFWCKWGHYIPLIIALFSALRLAKFNIDDEQTCEFIGLPTPACALFCASLGLLYTEGMSFPSEVIAVTSILLALLLISPYRMFALKFKGAGWRGNEIRYSFILISVILLATLQLHSLPIIVALYIILSIILHFACPKCR